MRLISLLAVLLVVAGLAVPLVHATPLPLSEQNQSDPYIWLEDVTGKRALDWVKSLNVESTRKLASSPQFESLKDRLLKILDSKDKIPAVTKHGPYYYNFWRDDEHVRGLWRRTTLDEYKKPKPAWETVIDLDELAADEKENWIWRGAVILRPERDRCMVSLSRGGADAKVVREFDLTEKKFVKDGFTLPEAKSNVAWRDRNTLYVGTDFGPGSLTKSGYPRLVKEWRRGTSLTDAKTVFEGNENDVSVSAYVSHDHGIKYDVINRSLAFYTNEVFLRQGDEWIKIDKPDDARFDTYADDVLLTLRSDWDVGGKKYLAGSLLAHNLQKYMDGDRDLQIVFLPTERSSLDGTSDTKNYLLLTVLDNVRSKAYTARKVNGEWSKQPLDAPEYGTISLAGIDSDESDDYFITVSDFLTPSTLYLGTVGDRHREKLKTQPQFFNTTGLQVQQFEAISRDGTMIPYFLVSRKDMKLDGSNPTLLYGYGGFEVSMLPGYNSRVGAAWLEKGGVYVLANIRGGSEFGPKWHEAARKENRQRAYDDFIAVAEDLIARKVTSSRHLGIEGGSNGGLLMGVMLTQRPDLFGAVHCGVPLLDMRRYNKLLAGASWMAEYGDPDKAEEWAYISKYSPYQNVKQGMSYPPILLTTSTRDDRVHPGHARKMVALLKSLAQDVTYYENIEGGHGGAANNEQAAFMAALAYTFLWDRLSHN